MDIQEVEENLKNYTDQLTHVDEALQLNSDNTDLASLRDDLKEIISITEKSLLNLKKNQLLANLAKEEEESDDDAENTDLSSYVGMKCSISYTSSWGMSHQQNCVIMSVDLPDDGATATSSETTIKVLFLTPSAKDMLPCKKYLDDCCTYERCKFSHGYSVPLSDICEYQEPCFDDFRRGKRCLCKNDSDLWVPGTVTNLTKEHVYFKFDGSGTEESLSYDDVFPLASLDNDSDSDLDQDQENVQYEDIIKSKQNLNFGGWEEHTNCFGSKMMMKMGYVPGKGLGPRGEGIVQPVEADIIPQGVSLDTIREFRQKNLIRTVYKLNVILKKRAEKQASNSNFKLQKSQSMFTMMDNIFKSRNNHTTNNHQKGNKNKQKITKVSDKTVRVKSVGIEYDINRSKRRISELKQSLKRNRADVGHCNRVQEQIKFEQNKLDGLMSNQKSVENELKYRSDKAKLKIF